MLALLAQDYRNAKVLGTNFDFGLTAFPFVFLASVLALLSSTTDGIKWQPSQTCSFISIATLPINFPQCQPLASHFSPFHSLSSFHNSFTVAAPRFFSVVVSEGRLVRNPAISAKLRIFRQQLRSPTRCGLQTNHNLHVVPEQSGNCAQAIASQAGHW